MNNLKLPARTKNILIRKYPNKISREDKIKIAETFFNIYKIKLMSNILKDEKNSFRELNRMTLISLVDKKASFNNQYFKYMKDKDIVMVQKTIEEYILSLSRDIHLNENTLIKTENKLIKVIHS